MASSFIRFRTIATILVTLTLAVCAYSQGTTGGLLYASDFANWSLPQGNTPMQGTIFYPNPDICKVTSNGYTFLAAKVGRPLTIVDGTNTETFTPSAVVVNNNTCMISGSMAHSHSSYSIKSGTAGAQEAIDYQASQPQGANIVLTPTWTQVGGSTGIVTGTLKGNSGVTILDQRTSLITPYVWNGSVYVASPFATIAGGAVVGNCAQIGPSGTITSTAGPCSSASGSVVASPQFSLFYQPTTGSASTAQGDSNATTDGSGNLQVNTVKSTATGLAPSTAPVCPNGTGGTFTTSGCATGGNPGGSTLQLQFNNAGAFGGAAGVSVDSSTKSIVQPSSIAASGAPIADIRHPSFAGGAVCDGVTDIGPALQAAWNSTPSTGGTIQIVGGATSGTYCYWANPGAFSWGSKTGYTTLQITGVLRVGSTLYIPSGKRVNLVGKNGASQAVSFQTPGDIAAVQLIPASGPGFGTLGTAVNVTTGTISNGSTSLTVADPTGYNIGDTIVMTAAATGGYDLTVTITNIVGSVFTVSAPAQGTATNAIIGHYITFTPSTMSGILPNSVLTVVDKITCNLTSVTRTSNIVTATLAAPCHIPPGVGVTIAGVTGGSTNFNGTPSGTQFLLNGNDWGTNVLSWKQTAANDTGTGGTITGTNEDTIEDTILVSATGVSTATAPFFRSHTSTAAWGVNGLYQNASSLNGLVQDLEFGAPGTVIVDGSYKSTYRRVGAGAVGACSGNPANFPMEAAGNFTVLDSISLTPCSQGWGLRMGNYANEPNFGPGPIYINDSFIVAGIKMDHGAAGLYVRNTVFDQATRGAVQIDPSNYFSGVQEVILLDSSGYNDNPNGFNTCFVYYTQSTTSTLANGNIDIRQPTTSGCTVNDYFTGRIKNGGPGYYSINTPRGVIGTYDDGKLMEGELRGIQAGLSPAIIPHATLPVKTDPATWPSGTCTPSGGIDAPDGTNTAGAITCSSGSGIIVETFNTVPAVGDYVIFGGWTRSLTPGKSAAGGGGGTPFTVDQGGNNGIQINGTGAYSTQAWDALFVDDWWHPVVSVGQITASNSTSTNFRFYINGDAARTMNFWMPFAIYIHASENIPLREINRWRSNLLHGYVPPSAVVGKAYGNNQVVVPGVDIQASPLVEELPNNTASGATLNKLVCAGNVAGVAKAQTCTTASTMWSGIAFDGAVGATAGNTQLARSGQVSCIFDGTTTFGDYVQISGTVAGDCHDTGATTYPASGAVVGRVWTVNGGAGTTATVNLYSPGISAAPCPTGAVGTPGCVQPDGTTITASGGVLSAVAGGGTVTSSGTIAANHPSCFSTSTNIVDCAQLTAPAFVPYRVARVDTTGLTNNVATTTAYAVPASGAGYYQVSCYEVITTAAGVSSAIPQCAVLFTDADTGVQAKDSSGGTSIRVGGVNAQIAVGNTNLNTTPSANSLVIHAAASTNIQYSTSSYASNAANAMTYALHFTVTYLGP